MQVTLPFNQAEDNFVWRHSNNGILSLKETYNFKTTPAQHLRWTKSIWSPDIPPSKSILAWRLMHNKVSTDDQLNLRGFSITSMCSCCSEAQETSFHLFFQCKHAIRIWAWFSNVLNINLHFQSVEVVWLITERRWSPQCKIVEIN